MNDLLDVSFVVQGDIVPVYTAVCLQRIRQFFPKAKIILSTWEGRDVVGMEYDEVVFSADPGFFYYSQRNGAQPNNVNRQIVSTMAGLKRVESEYAFKIRTDFLLTGDGFLKYFGQFNGAEAEYKLFQDKVLACAYFTRDPRGTLPYPFHLSDLAFLGRTEDLHTLFDVPLMTEDEAVMGDGKAFSNRYVPEQHIFINSLRQKGREVLCEAYNDCSERNTEETLRYFASNFILLNFEQFGIQPTKVHFSMSAYPRLFQSCITHHEWLALYKTYVDESVYLPAQDAERIRLNYFYKRYKLCHLGANVFSMFFRNKEKRRKARQAFIEFFLYRPVTL